jgi:hypothetical protein
LRKTLTTSSYRIRRKRSPGGAYAFTISFVEARFPAGGGGPTKPAFDGDTLVVRFDGAGPASVTDGAMEWYCAYTAPIDTDYIACVPPTGAPADELDVALISDCKGGMEITAAALVGGTVGGDDGYPACIEHYSVGE